VVFALPGDPVKALGGGRILPDATLEAIRAKYRLDQPLASQYVAYMGDLIQADLGESLVQRRPVREIIGEALPNTARLALAAILFEAGIGIAAGILAALRPRSFFDALVIATSTVAVSIPLFVTGYLLQLLFGVHWAVLPVTGLESGLESYLLPGFVLGSVSLAFVARLTRTSLTETMREPFIRTARAKGLGEARVLGRHAMKTSLLPVVTFLGVDFGFLLGGAVVVETVFNINGAGLAVYRAISQRDHLVIMGFSLVAVAAFLVLNLLVDLLYAWLDPRIRYE
jgi:ABC-type dipeptide/oligopeptide/nickel transport system permease component